MFIFNKYDLIVGMVEPGSSSFIHPVTVFVEIFYKWYLTQEMIEKIRHEVFFNIIEHEKIHICPIEIEVLQNVALIAEIKSDIKFDNHDKQVLATAMMFDCPLIISDKKLLYSSKGIN